MPTLSITKTYLNGNVLAEVDLDNIRTSITGFLNSTLLDSTNFQTGGLLGTNLANGTLSSTQIGNGAISGNTIASSAVTANAIGPLAVTSGAIANFAVTNKSFGAKNASTSVSCGAFATNASSFTQITNLAVTLTTNGRPVFVGLGPDRSAIDLITSTGQQIAVVTQASQGIFQILRNATQILYHVEPLGNHVSSLLSLIDFPASSSWTYSLNYQHQVSSTASTQLRFNSLIAYEL